VAFKASLIVALKELLVPVRSLSCTPTNNMMVVLATARLFAIARPTSLQLIFNER
jgi:hypothetical protein